MQNVLSRAQNSGIKRGNAEMRAGSFVSVLALLSGLLAAFVAVFFVSVSSSGAQASYQAKETVRSHHAINLKPGQAITFEIHFKNTGTSMWKRSGRNFVALATVDPEVRESAFEHEFWDKYYRPAFLREAEVARGEIGTFKFALKAPDAEGEYEETFQAVAKDLAWIKGARFTIPINVTADVEQETSGGNESDFTIKEDYPIQDDGYHAQWVGGQKAVINAEAGKQVLKSFKVKNAGSRAWNASGARFVSAYTVRPNYHPSPFASNGPGWMSEDQIRLASPSVGPGETGKVTVLLQAPDETGTHKDRVRMAAEDYTWMKGGELEIEMRVTGSESSQDGEPGDEETSEEETVYQDLSYQAKYLISSHREVTMRSGQNITFQVGFKNVGETTWRKNGTNFVSLYTVSPNYRASRFATQTAAAASVNDGWMSTSQIEMIQDEVKPGQLAYFRFDLSAPATSGAFREEFRLAAEDKTWIKGGEFTLPIRVKNRTGSLPEENEEVGDLGPMMRVGIFSADDPFSITADTEFEVRTDDSLIATVPARTEIQVDYQNGQYEVHSAAVNHTSNDPIVLQATEQDTIMEILSYERRLPWNPVVNENLFRGSIEINHSNATGKTWAINILPMEHYLRGIAETSSESPVEFLKVMSVAARTYATYHYERQTKHADEHFYVDSDYDQVYRGYALEKRHPSLVTAVKETTGEVVTYTDPETGETDIAITPYFSQSDGRTRGWSEVWGGEVPWAKSVPVPHDNGKSLLGHGVGMSARGGLLMVTEDNKEYDEVLHYFFEGIEIEDRY